MNKCVHCNKEFVRYTNKKYCSERCAINNYNKRKRAKDRKKPRICKNCGKNFISKNADIIGVPSLHLGNYCSDKCNKSILRAREARSSHNRRMKLKGGDLIDLYNLADIKQWNCWICKEEINKQAKHFRHNINLYGPSIDHIVPLSKGGTHIWSNVELAHVICNSLRGNKEVSA